MTIDWFRHERAQNLWRFSKSVAINKFWIIVIAQCENTKRKKKKGITRWKNNLGAPSGPGKKKSWLAKQFDGVNTRTPDHRLKSKQHYHCTKWCTLQFFCTQSLIKEIKKAQRLASKLEPETSGMEEASITTTLLEDLRLDTVSNLLKHSTLLKQKSAPAERKNNTCVTHFLFLIQN